LLMWLTSHHGPDSASDGRQSSDGQSVKLSKRNFLDFGVTTDRRSCDGPSLVPLEGYYGQLH
ncbi:hypothetical protein HAX54_033843, partial [Datura stramonium]|nr:hypothetical protein [Datura stramonium]